MSLLLKSRQKILLALLKNPGINVNDLMKIVGSLRDIKSLINELEKNGFIKSKFVGKTRQLFPDLSTPTALSVFELVEAEEKNGLLGEFPVAKAFEQRLDSIKGSLKGNLLSVVLFGSIASGGYSKKSDIDVLFLVKKASIVPEQSLAKLFQTISFNLGKEINPQWIEKKEFLKQLDNPTSFASQVQKNHIVLLGTKDFLKNLKTK